MHKMSKILIENEIEEKWGIPAAVGIGFGVGLAAGAIGFFCAELIGFNRQDTVLFIGGVGGLAVALVFNNTMRKETRFYLNQIYSLREEIKELSKNR